MYKLKVLLTLIRILEVVSFICAVYLVALGGFAKFAKDGISVFILAIVTIVVIFGLIAIDAKLVERIDKKKSVEYDKWLIEKSKNQQPYSNRQYITNEYKGGTMNQSFIEAARRLELPNNISTAQEFISQKKYVDAMKCYEKEEMEIHKLCSSERNQRLIVLYSQMANLCRLVGDRDGEGVYLGKNVDINKQIQSDEFRAKLESCRRRESQANNISKTKDRRAALCGIYADISEIYFSMHDMENYHRYQKMSNEMKSLQQWIREHEDN